MAMHNSWKQIEEAPNVRIVNFKNARSHSALMLRVRIAYITDEYGAVVHSLVQVELETQILRITEILWHWIQAKQTTQSH